MDYYRIATCVPQDCSLLTKVMYRTIKWCFASRTESCWLKLVWSEFYLSMWITYWIFLDENTMLWKTNRMLHVIRKQKKNQNKPKPRTAQTSAMLSTSVFSFNNLERIDHRAPEQLKNCEGIPSNIPFSHSRSSKIYAPIFPHKFHHQKLIARVKFLYQYISSLLRSRGTVFASW